MTLETFYNVSIQHMQSANLGRMTISLFETAFRNPAFFYLIVFITLAALVYIKAQNFGLVGIFVGILSESLYSLGKFPIYFHGIAYIIVAISIFITLFLFFTDNNYG